MYGLNNETRQSHSFPEQNGVHNEGGDGDNQPSRRAMPHIDDLKTKAQARFDPYAPVGFHRSISASIPLTCHARYPDFYR